MTDPAGNPDIGAALAQYISEFKMEVLTQGDRHRLEASGFFPIEWREPRRRSLLRRGKNQYRFEEASTAALTFFLERRPISTFFDIGAYCGYFSLLALSHKARPIHVHAFEPQPELYAVLAANLKACTTGGGAEPLLAGLSDRHLGQQPVWHSQTKMFESEPERRHYGDSAWVRLKFALRGTRARDAPRKSQATITSIDHYCADRGVVPDAIKIDVDGYEAKVIPGGMATFRRHRPVTLLELHRARYISRFGVSRTAILRPLFDAGYNALLIEDHMSHGSSVTPVEADSPVIERDQTDMYVFY